MNCQTKVEGQQERINGKHAAEMAREVCMNERYALTGVFIATGAFDLVVDVFLCPRVQSE